MNKMKFGSKKSYAVKRKVENILYTISIPANTIVYSIHGTLYSVSCRSMSKREQTWF